VGDAQRAVEAVAAGDDLFFQHADPADAARQVQGAGGLPRAAVEHGQPGRVVAAVLQTLEPLNQERRGGLVADVSDDSTHTDRVLEKGADSRITPENDAASRDDMR